MKRIFNALKVTALLGAFVALSWTATAPSTATADGVLTCGGSGHTCHVEHDGAIHHLRVVHRY